MRFFFDFRARDRALFDYRGDEFRSAEAAIKFAGAIAEDLQHSLAAEWLGWWIEVRNSEGMKFSSLPVDTAGENFGARDLQSTPRRAHSVRVDARRRRRVLKLLQQPLKS